MKTFRTLISIIAAALTMVSICSFMPENVKTYKGQMTSECGGLKETKDGFVVNVSGDGLERKFSLENFETLGMKGISITATMILDEDGNILSCKDVTIKGAPAKLSKMTGTVTDTGADVTLSGKAVVVVPFTVRYQAKRL